MTHVKFESFVSRSEAQASHRIGFIGLGQCGGNYTDLFSSLKDNNKKSFYDCIAINSFLGDLKSLKNIPHDRKYALVGVEGGCGRKPELAKEALKNPDNQNRLIELIKSNLMDNPMYIVNAGLGGGTGTGIIVTMIKLLHKVINVPLIKQGKKPKPIGAIVTIPRKSEAPAEKKNALNAIKQIEKMMNSKEYEFKFIIIVDNEKAYREFKQLDLKNDTKFDNWMDYCNQQIVESIHEVNVATSFSSDKSFDPQEVLNIYGEWEGALTLGKIKFKSKDIIDSIDLVNKIVKTFQEGSVLADGFNLENTRTAGVLIVKPTSNKIISKNSLYDIEDKLAEIMPSSLYRSTGYIEWYNPNDTIIYTMAKVQELPERAREGLSLEYNATMNKIKENVKNTKIKTEYSDIDDDIFNSQSSKQINDNFDPFSDEAAASDDLKEDEDFSDVFDLD
ncbi:MAG: hypothetical protein MJA82_09145 [Clostridia bacterium]|nr:hypothetical protein [Clostridia bacterium]